MIQKDRIPVSLTSTGEWMTQGYGPFVSSTNKA